MQPLNNWGLMENKMEPEVYLFQSSDCNGPELPMDITGRYIWHDNMQLTSHLYNRLYLLAQDGLAKVGCA